MIFTWSLMFYCCRKVLNLVMLLADVHELSRWLTPNKPGMYGFMWHGSLKNITKLYKYQGIKSKYFMIKIALFCVNDALHASFETSCKYESEQIHSNKKGTGEQWWSFQTLKPLFMCILQITVSLKLILSWILAKIWIFCV